MRVPCTVTLADGTVIDCTMERTEGMAGFGFADLRNLDGVPQPIPPQAQLDIALDAGDSLPGYLLATFDGVDDPDMLELTIEERPDDPPPLPPMPPRG